MAILRVGMWIGIFVGRRRSERPWMWVCVPAALPVVPGAVLVGGLSVMSYIGD